MRPEIRTELLALLDKVGEAVYVDLVDRTVIIAYENHRAAGAAYDLITHSPTLRDHLRESVSPPPPSGEGGK